MAVKMNYCKEVTPATNAQGTYYVVIERSYEGSKDCTKATTCDACMAVIEVAKATEHKLSVTRTYASYTQAGVRTETCSNEGCEHNVTTNPNALIVYKGYSKNDIGTQMCVGYDVNYAAMAEYKAVNGLEEIFEFGMVVSAESTVANGQPLVIEGTKVATAQTIGTGKVIKASINSDSYTHIDFKLTGDYTAYQEFPFLMSAYIYDGQKLVYIQSTESSNVTSVTIGSLPME